MSDQTELYTPKTASKLVGVDPELLKLWCNEFNVVTTRTEGGHRRYSKENIQELKAIKEKLHDQGWSYDQVRAWRNGEIEAFTTKQERSEIEKKLDRVLEELEIQRQFNQALIERLDVLKQQNDALMQMNLKLHEENQALRGFIGERDQRLIESLRNTLEEKKQQKKRIGILAGLFKKEG